MSQLENASIVATNTEEEDGLIWGPGPRVLSVPAAGSGAAICPMSLLISLSDLTHHHQNKIYPPAK